MLHWCSSRFCLGPSLFLLYINDSTFCSDKFNYTLFADDTCLFSSHKDEEHLQNEINSGLISVKSLLINNKLSISISKLCYILFLKKKTNIEELSLKISNTNLERKQSTKYLGVVIDEHLTWKPHLSLILGKIRQDLGIICKLTHILPPKTLD